MHSDPYSPPESDVDVAESLPVRPVRGIVIALVFYIVSVVSIAAIVGLYVALFVFDVDAPVSERKSVVVPTQLFNTINLIRTLTKLVVSFAAGYLCILVSRGRNLRYPLILAGLILLMNIPTFFNDPLSPHKLFVLIAAFGITLIGARVAIRKYQYRFRSRKS